MERANADTAARYRIRGLSLRLPKGMSQNLYPTKHRNPHRTGRGAMPPGSIVSQWSAPGRQAHELAPMSVTDVSSDGDAARRRDGQIVPLRAQRVADVFRPHERR